MNDKKKTYRKEIIDLADALFANPDKKKADVVRNFAEKCGKSSRTVERWVMKAQEYNRERLKKQEVIKDEAMAENAIKQFEAGLLSRNEVLKILSDIAKGDTKTVDGTIIVPTPSEQIKAIQQLSKMQGWDAPIKTEQKALTSTIVMNVIKGDIPLAEREEDVVM